MTFAEILPAHLAGKRVRLRRSFGRRFLFLAFGEQNNWRLAKSGSLGRRTDRRQNLTLVESRKRIVESEEKRVARIDETPDSTV